MVNTITALCIVAIVALYVLPMWFVCPFVGVEVKGGLLGGIETWLDCTPQVYQASGILFVIGLIFYFFGNNIRLPSIRRSYRFSHDNFYRNDRTPSVKKALIVLIILLFFLFYMTNANFKESINNAAKSVTNSTGSASGNPTISDINNNIINYDGKTVTTEGFYVTWGRNMDKHVLTLNEGIYSGSNSYLRVVVPYGDSRFNVLSTVSCKLSAPLYRVTGVIRVVWSGGSSSSPSEISMDPTSVEFVRCQKLY